MLQSTPNRWFIGRNTESIAPVRLFAFAYAGGSASVFRSWHKALPPGIDLYAVQLPGRESRFTEPRLTQFTEAIEAIVKALGPSLDRPFAFFGHSLGALLAFETARHLRRSGAPLPAHLFLSGHSAPQVHDPIEAYSKLSDAAFIESIKKYGGIPDEILQNAELIELFLPVVRADFSLLETYHYIQEPALDCPISAFGGLDDLETSQSKLAAWNIHTSQSFKLNMFPGDHFYLNTARPILLDKIIRDLAIFFKE